MSSSSFIVNDQFWVVRVVNPDNPVLIDRTGELRVATTDPFRQTVFLSNRLKGEFRLRVLLHELSHVVLFSYGLLDIVHSRLNPKDWIAAEEWLCNFMADYGQIIFTIANDILGNDEVSQAIS